MLTDRFIVNLAVEIITALSSRWQVPNTPLISSQGYVLHVAAADHVRTAVHMVLIHLQFSGGSYRNSITTTRKVAWRVCKELKIAIGYGRLVPRLCQFSMKFAAAY